jgi:predicted amidohydrolase YtcJ
VSRRLPLNTGRTLFRGGPVISFDGARHDALAVEHGMVAAVGRDADRGVGFDQIVELDGRPLLPGFRDGHAHPLHAGINRLELDLTGVTTLDVLQRRVAEWRQCHPEQRWIVGRCYEPSMLPLSIGRAEWLDAACADRPVTLFPSDHHSIWANTAAIAAAGITADTPEPARGAIVRDGDGTPVGQFLEFGGIELFRQLLPQPTFEHQVAGLTECQRLLSADGVVWAQDAKVTLDELEVYMAGARSGGLTCRINAAFMADPATWRQQLGGFVAGRAATLADEQVSPWVTATTVKFFADGVIESGTGFLLEPYEDAPHTCGLPNWSAEGLDGAVAAFDADGFQIHIHAIGDAGVRMALDAVEHAQRRNGVRDRRAVIAHTQLVHDDDKPRFAALGVIANFEPLWAAYDDFMERLAVPRIGRARTALQYPIASLAAAGARIGFGSDWPVSSYRPLDGLAVAVSRQNAAGEPVEGWIPEERYPILESIRAYTQGSAFQAFDDDAGELAVGQRADLVVLDHDITAMAGNEIKHVQVDQTWLQGRQVFQR